MSEHEPHDGAESDDGDDGEGLRGRWATLALVAVNVAVFAAMVLAGASPLYTGAAAVHAGGVDPARVWDGEVWRFLTACFIHLGIWHLALNAWVLWQLGPVLERFVGASRMLLIYFATGVFGFALSTALVAVPSAGASGAIFGVTGALLAVALMLRGDTRRTHGELGRTLLGALLPFVVATFALGFLVPDIVDNTAHVGGLVFGLLAGYGLAAGDPALFAGAGAGRGARARGLVALVGAAVLFVVVAAYGARPVLSPQYHAVVGLQALQNRGPGTPTAADLEEARTHAAAAARLGADDAATFVLLGRLREEAARAAHAGDDAAAAAEHAEAARLVREGLARVDEEGPLAQWTRLVRGLALGGGTDELPFGDHRTVDALCDAALAVGGAAAGNAAGGAGGTAMGGAADAGDAAGDPAGRAELDNACAWLRLKAGDPTVRDPAGALALARRAVEATEGKNANIVHTLAEALAQNGQPREGLAWLEKIAATGGAGTLAGGDDFLAAERRRLSRMIE